MLYETYHEKENKNNFHNLIGKDYLLDFDKYILFNVNEKKFKKIIEDNECQMLDIFLLKSKNEGNQNEKFKEEVSFSLVAPFYNFIFENNLNLKNFIFRNMEIYEQFYLFLENVDFNKTSNDFKDILEDLQTFYNQKINYFVERLPSVLRSSFEEDLLILKEKVINKISIEKLKELEEIIRNANSEKETNASIK